MGLVLLFPLSFLFVKRPRRVSRMLPDGAHEEHTLLIINCVFPYHGMCSGGKACSCVLSMLAVGTGKRGGRGKILGVPMT